MKKLMAKGLARCVGQAASFGDRARHVFAGPDVPVRKNQLRHDCFQMSIELALEVTALRGSAAGERLPDLRLAVERIDIELDCGSMRYDEIEERFGEYAYSFDWCVWISAGLWRAADETRMEEMRKRSRSISHCAWFCTLGDLLKHKWECPVVNFYERQMPLNELLTSCVDASMVCQPLDDEYSPAETVEDVQVVNNVLTKE